MGHTETSCKWMQGILYFYGDQTDGIISVVGLCVYLSMPSVTVGNGTRNLPECGLYVIMYMLALYLTCLVYKYGQC